MKLNVKQNLRNCLINNVLSVKNATQKMRISGSKAKNYMNVKILTLSN